MPKNSKPTPAKSAIISRILFLFIAVQNNHNHYFYYSTPGSGFRSGAYARMQSMSRPGKTVNIILITAAFLALVAGVIWGSTRLAGHFSKSPTSSNACPRSGAVHSVLIKKGVVTPYNTVAKRCDILAITNLDDKSRLMAFGEHSHHQPYDGVEEKLLSKDQTWRVKLTQTGNFHFHDHLDDAVQGTFSVR